MFLFELPDALYTTDRGKGQAKSLIAEAGDVNVGPLDAVLPRRR